MSSIHFGVSTVEKLCISVVETSGKSLFSDQMSQRSLCKSQVREGVGRTSLGLLWFLEPELQGFCSAIGCFASNECLIGLRFCGV